MTLQSQIDTCPIILSTSPSRLDACRSSRNAISPGIVATRVSILQNHPSSPSSDSLSSFKARHREHSRSGFGRRLSLGFGPPACHNDSPNEKHQVKASHSFVDLGLKYKQHLAITNDGVGIDRTPGLDGLVDSKRAAQRLQSDAASPWSFKQPKFVQSSQQASNSFDVNSSRGFDDFGNDGHLRWQPSIHHTTHHQTYTPRAHGIRPKYYTEDSIKSGRSCVTSSTVRRQSVRDLFDQYGIERPPGLVSDDESEIRDDTPSPYCLRICHVCSLTNVETYSRCKRCAHILCRQCETRHPAINHHETVHRHKDSRWEESDAPMRASCRKEKSTANLRDCRARSRPQCAPASSDKRDTHKHDTFHGSIEMFPSFRAKQHSKYITRERTPIPAAPQCSVTTVLPCKINNFRTVKDSPFLIADRLCTEGRHVDLAVGGNPTAHNHHHSNQHNHDPEPEQRRLPSPPPVKFESLTCRSSHPGHKPYRHSVSCRAENAQDVCQNDCYTETSHIEEVRHSHHHSHFLSQPSSRSPSPLPDYHSSHIAEQESDSEPAAQSQHIRCLSSEVIECHGYPRTGHARHGSVKPENLGECQHCKPDCKCDACQRTHHNVRCCMHKDHRTVVHHHHSHMLTSSDSRPIECSEAPTPEEISRCPSPVKRKLCTPPPFKQESKKTRGDPIKKTSSPTPAKESPKEARVPTPPPIAPPTPPPAALPTAPSKLASPVSSKSADKGTPAPSPAPLVTPTKTLFWPALKRLPTQKYQRASTPPPPSPPPIPRSEPTAVTPSSRPTWVQSSAAKSWLKKTPKAPTPPSPPQPKRPVSKSESNPTPVSSPKRAYQSPSTLPKPYSRPVMTNVSKHSHQRPSAPPPIPPPKPQSKSPVFKQDSDLALTRLLKKETHKAQSSSPMLFPLQPTSKHVWRRSPKPVNKVNQRPPKSRPLQPVSKPVYRQVEIADPLSANSHANPHPPPTEERSPDHQTSLCEEFKQESKSELVSEHQDTHRPSLLYPRHEASLMEQCESEDSEESSDEPSPPPCEHTSSPSQSPSRSPEQGTSKSGTTSPSNKESPMQDYFPPPCIEEEPSSSNQINPDSEDELAPEGKWDVEIQHSLSDDESVSNNSLDEDSISADDHYEEAKAGSEHRLSEDSRREGVSSMEEHDLSDYGSCEESSTSEDNAICRDETTTKERAQSNGDSSTWIDPPRNGDREHECVCKDRYFDDSSNQLIRERKGESSGDLPPVGITVIVHVKGKADMVFKTDLTD
jgi:hypothetical protein